MHSETFRIPGVAMETLAEICYLCRFLRSFGPPLSSEKLFQALSPGSIIDFLQDYSLTYSSSSLERMQILLRSFLRFAYRSSRIERDLSALVPTRKYRQPGVLPRGFPAAKGGRPVEQHLVAEAGNLLSEYVRHARPASEYPEVFLTLCEPFCPMPAAKGGCPGMRVGRRTALPTRWPAT